MNADARMTRRLGQVKEHLEFLNHDYEDEIREAAIGMAFGFPVHVKWDETLQRIKFERDDSQDWG